MELIWWTFHFIGSSEQFSKKEEKKLRVVFSKMEQI